MYTLQIDKIQNLYKYDVPQQLKVSASRKQSKCESAYFLSALLLSFLLLTSNSKYD